jgi:hypothetical protein
VIETSLKLSLDPSYALADHRYYIQTQMHGQKGRKDSDLDPAKTILAFWCEKLRPESLQ